MDNDHGIPKLPAQLIQPALQYSLQKLFKIARFLLLPIFRPVFLAALCTLCGLFDSGDTTLPVLLPGHADIEKRQKVKQKQLKAGRAVRLEL